MNHLKIESDIITDTLSSTLIFKFLLNIVLEILGNVGPKIYSIAVCRLKLTYIKDKNTFMVYIIINYSFRWHFMVVNIQLDFSVFLITQFSGGQNEVVRYFSCCVFGS